MWRDNERWRKGEKNLEDVFCCDKYLAKKQRTKEVLFPMATKNAKKELKGGSYANNKNLHWGCCKCKWGHTLFNCLFSLRRRRRRRLDTITPSSQPLKRIFSRRTDRGCAFPFHRMSGVVVVHPISPAIRNSISVLSLVPQWHNNTYCKLHSLLVGWLVEWSRGANRVLLN